MPDAPMQLSSRPDAARAGDRQPAEQREQVHGQRRSRLADGREKEGNEAVISRARQRHRHRSRALPSLWEMFAQVDTSLERSRGGLGIGLTLVKTLVEMHGGTVQAHSDGLARGSEFTVRLPMLVRRGRCRPHSTGVSEPPLPTMRRRVLIVDDSEDGAESLADVAAARRARHVTSLTTVSRRLKPQRSSVPMSSCSTSAFRGSMATRSAIVCARSRGRRTWCSWR